MIVNTAIVTGADGLVTGWHEAEASHLLLSEAVGGAAQAARSVAVLRQRLYP